MQIKMRPIPSENGDMIFPLSENLQSTSLPNFVTSGRRKPQTHLNASIKNVTRNLRLPDNPR